MQLEGTCYELWGARFKVVKMLQVISGHLYCCLDECMLSRLICQLVCLTVWLNTTSPLISVLERAEELTLSAEVMKAIQPSLQLMDNTNQHNSIAQRNALLIHLNPQFKQLVEDVNFE